MAGNQGYLLNALKPGGRDTEIAFSSGDASADESLGKSYAKMLDSGLQRLVPNGNVIVSNREPNSRCTSVIREPLLHLICYHLLSAVFERDVMLKDQAVALPVLAQVASFWIPH